MGCERASIRAKAGGAQPEIIEWQIFECLSKLSSLANFVEDNVRKQRLIIYSDMRTTFPIQCAAQSDAGPLVGAKPDTLCTITQEVTGGQNCIDVMFDCEPSHTP